MEALRREQQRDAMSSQSQQTVQIATVKSNRTTEYLGAALMLLAMMLVRCDAAQAITCSEGTVTIHPRETPFEICFNNNCKTFTNRTAILQYELEPSPHTAKTLVTLTSENQIAQRRCETPSLCKHASKFLSKALIGNPNCWPEGAIISLSIICYCVASLTALLIWLAATSAPRERDKAPFSLSNFRPAALNLTETVLVMRLCLELRHGNVTIGHIKVTRISEHLACKKVSLFWIRDTRQQVDHNVRCRGLGSCHDDVCESLTPSDMIPELNSSALYPGYSGCSIQCSGVNCICPIPFRACTFYRVSHIPLSSQIYEVFRCAAWEPDLIFEIEVEVYNSRKRERLSLIPYVAKNFADFKFTVISTQMPQTLPHQKFAQSGNETLLIPDEFLFSVTCDTQANAQYNFSSCDNKLYCACDVTGIKPSCRCPHFPLTQIRENHNSVLPHNSNLMKAQKHNAREIPEVGEIVLIEHELLPRGHWTCGRVVELVPSADGLIRSAKLKLPHWKAPLTRPITKLYPLEIRAPPVERNSENGHVSSGTETTNSERATIKMTTQRRVQQPRTAKTKAMEALRREQQRDAMSSQSQQTVQIATVKSNRTTEYLGAALMLLAMMLVRCDAAQAITCSEGTVTIHPRETPFEICFNNNCKTFTNRTAILQYELEPSPHTAKTLVTLTSENQIAQRRCETPSLCKHASKFLSKALIGNPNCWPEGAIISLSIICYCVASLTALLIWLAVRKRRKQKAGTSNTLTVELQATSAPRERDKAPFSLSNFRPAALNLTEVVLVLVRRDLFIAFRSNCGAHGGLSKASGSWKCNQGYNGKRGSLNHLGSQKVSVSDTRQVASKV
ncbi:hypothetical protein OSTOST_06757 [Ostertagia ostertagi]